MSGRRPWRLRLDRTRAGAAIAVALLLGWALMHGYRAEMVSSDERALGSIAQTMALMHFRYHGFIGSVQKKQV